MWVLDRVFPKESLWEKLAEIYKLLVINDLYTFNQFHVR